MGLDTGGGGGTRVGPRSLQSPFVHGCVCFSGREQRPHIGVEGPTKEEGEVRGGFGVLRCLGSTGRRDESAGTGVGY